MPLTVTATRQTLAGAVLALGGFAASAANAQTACADLMALKMPHAAVTSATVIPAAGKLPAYCRVMVTARPSADSDIRIEVAIPEGAAWNGRYLQVGNGGFAGAIPQFLITLGLAQGFATAGTDDGHQSAVGTNADWALGHPEKVVDFGHRALKETTDAAKAVIGAYAARAPDHAYFAGCSDGGREALMEVERYPLDFDGVLAGDPASRWTHLLAASAWNTQALMASPASYIPMSKLKAIQTAEEKACGDEDGVIENPLACHFNPAVIQCAAGADTDQCLTSAQVVTLRKIYAGAKDPRTGKTILAGFDPGGEAWPGGWGPWMIGAGPGPLGHTLQYEFGRNFYQFIAFGDPKYDIRKLDFARDIAVIDAKYAPILNADAVDLSAFARHGGKLIQYHGWADPAIPPRDSIAHYEAVKARMGEVAGFYRLFMAPGMQHCFGGPGPNAVQGPALTALVAWVEGGKAPERLIVSKYQNDNLQGAVVRTRPLCPYPQAAAWNGEGDKKNPDSFLCKVPAKRG